MSSHNQNDNTSASPNFVSIVLILTFVLTFVILSFGNFPTPVVEANDDASVAVADVATDAPVPTATDMPPTATPTSLPTNTATDVPTATIPPTVEPTTEPESTTGEGATTANTDYDPDVVAHGESLFVACAACHGPEGLGVPNLGKNLVDSEFVHSLSDDELVDFIKVGRPIWDPLNTTGIDMPPKGGNPILTDEDMLAIVAYVRSLAPGDTSANTPDETTPSSDASADTSAVTANTDYDPDVVAHGESLFVACAACHGPEGLGVPNLGKNLVDSEFVHSLSDDELVDFIKVGRPIWDPLNTTGIDMPPKGGNPVLTDEDMLAIVAYVRSLAPGDTSANTSQETTPSSDASTDTSAVTANTDYDPDVVAHGESLFVACAACHGPEGLGVPNLGKNLVDSEFVHSLSDDELVDFIKVGRPIWDPLNTTGIDMPPKGGNPVLTDDDMLAIVAYIRNLNK